MEKLKKTAVLSALGIIGVLGGTTALYLMNILNEGAFILAAIACYPMVKTLCHFATRVCRDPIRILGKALPKAGFTIDTTKSDDRRNVVRYYGKYQGDNFMIEASHDCAYITIYDMPWHGVKSTDPAVGKILEAINEVNSKASNISVTMSEPDDEGIRQIYTLTSTILPGYHPEQYLDSLMCDMLNRKPAFVKAMEKDRPYMSQRRGSIGFNVETPSAEPDNQISPAAKADI